MSFCLPLSLACRCAEKASQKGYTVFGLQFYGECWSGQNAEFNFNREGAAKDEKCVMNLNKPTECVQSSNQECVGTQWTNYVYKLTESKLNKAKKNTSVISWLLKMAVSLHCGLRKIRFEFLIVFHQRMEQHFQNFQRRGRPLRGISKFSEIVYWEFLFHLTFLPEFLFERFAFWKFNIFRTFWKLRKFPCNFSTFPNFRNV